MRYAIPLLMVLVVGCLPSDTAKKEEAKPGDSPATEVGKKSGELTADEKTAWAKKRKQESKDQRYIVVGYVIGEKSWSPWCYKLLLEGPNAGGYEWTKGMGYRDAKTTINGMKGKAVSLSEQPAIKLVAVLDLYTHENPVVIAWAQDNGKGGKLIDRPPSDELERSLAEYICDLQRSETRP